jgi:hypothetical protein
MIPEARAPRAARTPAHRWMRQLHLWLGAWGALAAILYGLTGLVMNHRFGTGAWPQGDSEETARTSLPIPPEARTSPETLSLWLQRTQALEAQVIRKGAPGGGHGAASLRWTLSGGTASDSWVLEYAPGSGTGEVRRSTHAPLAAFNRLHKGVGGGWAWLLLADSFAIGMTLLGLSGLWMWARGRSPMQMLGSVLGL